MGGQFIALSDARDRQEEVISYLPLSHIAAQMCDIWAAMSFGVQVYFAQPDALKVKKKDNKLTPIYLLELGWVLETRWCYLVILSAFLNGFTLPTDQVPLLV